MGAMSETGSDGDSRFAGASPESLASGQRTLAAIVFTDTVGFSALMSKDEERTLRLVARDLDQMRATCEAFGGQVLKSTGDGLLMLFTSAVQAVACALEIQRELQKRSIDLPKVERLQHRIGIHLGDVFQHAGDVMGDGVNIAARLQTEAVPGGICLSKTVYDVVHNRLAFYVNDLGARRLKNLGTVTAYQISPVVGGAGSRFSIAWYRWRPWLWRGVGILVVLVILGLVFKLGQKHQEDKSAAHFAAKRKIIEERAASLPPPVVTSPTSELTEASETEFEIARFEHMQKYDFDGMSDWIAAHNWPGKETETLGETCRRLDHLFDWSQEQLQKYTVAHPLVFMGSGDKSFAFWPTALGGLKMKRNGEITILTRDRIPPITMVGIIHQLLHENPPADLASEQQLHGELELFITTYHINVPLRGEMWQELRKRLDSR